MRNFSSTKVGVIFSLLLFLYTNGFAQNFLLNGDLIDDRAKDKILQMGNEVKSKLGVNIYLDSKVDLNIDPKLPTKNKLELIKIYEDNILKNLEEPYVLLTIAMEQTHVNLYTSDSLKKIIDKNDILNDYVVPLLASKDKNTLASKVSAATLNGYAAIADTLAASEKIKLESSIGSQGKTFSTIWRAFIITLVLAALLAYIYTVLRKRK